MNSTARKHLSEAKAELNGVEFYRPSEKRLRGEIEIAARRLKEAPAELIPGKIETLQRLFAELSTVLEQPPVCPTCGQEMKP